MGTAHPTIRNFCNVRANPPTSDLLTFYLFRLPTSVLPSHFQSHLPNFSSSHLLSFPLPTFSSSHHPTSAFRLPTSVPTFSPSSPLSVFLFTFSVLSTQSYMLPLAKRSSSVTLLKRSAHLLLPPSQLLIFSTSVFSPSHPLSFILSPFSFRLLSSLLLSFLSSQPPIFLACRLP